MKDTTRKQKAKRRSTRIRAKILGTKKRPRLSVFRSNKHIYAQLIDDENAKTLAFSSDKGLKTKGLVLSKEVGALIAKQAVELKIKEVIFDRGSYKYHGNVKALAEGAREGGLKF